MSVNTKYFWSSMTGAPSLAASPSGLIALLNACLVDGFNANTVTITRDGTTATVYQPGHGMTNGGYNRILGFSGAEQPEYNIEAAISVVDDDHYTYAVDGDPATPATGTITAKVAAAGWTREYTGANLAAYRAGGGNRMYLRVDDTQNQYATVRGYQAMSGASAGSDVFGLVYWWKSQDATGGRPWRLVANDRMLHLWIGGLGSLTGGTYSDCYTFGDLKPYMTGDQFATMLSGNSALTTPFSDYSGVRGSVPNNTPSEGHYICRDYTYVSGQKTVSRFHDAGKACVNSSSFNLGGGGLVYPHPVDGGLYMSRVWIGRNYHVRGEIPGLWAPLHDRPLTGMDTFDGSNDLAGRRFLAVPCGYSAYYGQLFLEISDTWDV